MIRSGIMLTGLFLTVAAVMLLCSRPASVFAHAIVIESSPADGATLREPPTQIVLRFDAKIIHSLAVYDLTSGDGKRIAVPAPRDKRAMAASPDLLVIPVPRLKPGSYVLRYKVLATDGHATLGILHFSIK